MTIYTELTPNPSTIKFVTEKQLMKRGTAEIRNREEASQSAFAQHLFELDFVESIFLGTNFVSVTKSSDKTWEEIIPQIKKSISDFLETGKEIIEIPEEEEELSAEEDSIVVKKIKQLLEDSIRPAVAMDGGDVVFEKFENGVVLLRLQGACSGCPSSSLTLKSGIEGLLTRMIPEVKSVEAVNQ